MRRNVRPSQFTINPKSSLAQGLVFAGLGRHIGGNFYCDSSLYGNYGTLTGYTGAGNLPSDRWTVNGTIGRAALSFNGSSDYVNCGTWSVGWPTTMACWYTQSPDLSSPNSWYEAHLFCKGGDWPGPYTYGLYLYSSNKSTSALQLGFCSRQYSGGGSPSSFVASAIAYTTIPSHSCATVAADASVIVYNNGISIATGTAQEFVANSQQMLIGITNRSYPYTYPFRGSISDPMQWSRALSTPEILALADRSNVLLECGSQPLCLPPRTVWPVGVAGGPAVVAPNLCARHRKLTIDHTLIAEGSSNYAVLLAGSGDTSFGARLPDDLFAACQSDFGDVCFATGADGSGRLSAEIVSYDIANKRAEIWVAITSMSSSADTEIYVFYKSNSGTLTQPAADAAYGKQAVQTDVGNVVSRFHFGTTSAISLADSTGTNNGTNVSMTSGAGWIGGAGLCNGTQYATFPTTSFPVGSSDRHVSVWAKMSAFGCIFEYGTRDFNKDFEIFNYNLADYYTLVGWYGDNCKSGLNPFPDGEWHRVDGVITSNVWKVYVDGVWKADATNNSTNTGAGTTGNFGRETGGSSYISGGVDECVVYSAVHSDAWITTDYNLQFSPALVLVDGAVVTVSAVGYTEELTAWAGELCSEGDKRSDGGGVRCKTASNSRGPWAGDYSESTDYYTGNVITGGAYNPGGYYICLADNGPNTGAGVQGPGNGSYWSGIPGPYAGPGDADAGTYWEAYDPKHDQVDVLTIDADVNGGTFWLYDATQADPVGEFAWDITTAALESGMQAYYGAGSIHIDGNDGGPWTITFQDWMRGTPKTLLASGYPLVYGTSVPASAATSIAAILASQHFVGYGLGI